MRTSLQYSSFTGRKSGMANGPNSSHRKYGRGHSLKIKILEQGVTDVTNNKQIFA